MELVLVGLPGSGKSAVGARLAARHGAEFVDLDRLIEQRAGRRVPEIFAAEGESGFRAREAAAIEAIGPAQTAATLRRVIATGGGAVVEPRNRWRLYRRRRVAWLDASPGRLARRLGDPRSRPLLAGRDPVETLRQLRDRRARFYDAGTRVDAEGPRSHVVERLEHALAAIGPTGTRLLRADTAVGRLDLGHAHAEAALRDAVGRLEAYRLAVVSEPTVWRLHGGVLASQLAEAGYAPVRVLAPTGEAAKTFAALERLLRQLARRRLERSDPLVALGGGALGDVAGLAAAIYLRGVPLIHVPTTLLAQIDSAIGGKTAVDLPEGKNLVGAFHQPQAMILDV
ncbi:MAG: iron-containing alcohol dehydrogenase, partial [Chloroflexota bacterium]|nr:iron-containing alcohol dehydrogenase [Chloroflexota bacterium]